MRFEEIIADNDKPEVGDIVYFEVNDITVETFVVATSEDGMVLEANYDFLLDLAKENLIEAEYQGRSVPLGKPMKGDVKKSKVYVKNPKTGKVIKVNFGDKKLSIKKHLPKHRKSFRARHHCENPGPRTKARYWSCRAW